jgi:hypothetical protein
MNQYGFIEITLIKNERPYRALLPLGTSWKDAHEALLDITQQIEDHIKAAEAAQAEAEQPTGE